MSYISFDTCETPMAGQSLTKMIVSMLRLMETSSVSISQTKSDLDTTPSFTEIAAVALMENGITTPN